MNLVSIQEVQMENAISDKAVTCGFFARLVPEAPGKAPDPPLRGPFCPIFDTKYKTRCPRTLIKPFTKVRFRARADTAISPRVPGTSNHASPRSGSVKRSWSGDGISSYRGKRRPKHSAPGLPAAGVGAGTLRLPRLMVVSASPRRRCESRYSAFPKATADM